MTWVPADLLARGGVRLEHDGALATVVLDRPDVLNAQTPATWDALTAIGEGLPAGVRVVVLRAEGRSFSAGLDRRVLDGRGVPGEEGSSLPGLALLAPSDLDAVIARFQRAFTWWRQCPAVTVAVVQGHAIGAGFQLALGCDLRVLTDDARLAMREPSLGLVPDLGGTKPLADQVGYARALEICATGRFVDAAEAAALGLATAVVPGAQVAAAVDDLVAALLAAPGGAVAETKALLRDAHDRSPEQQLAAERAAQGRRLAELAALAGARR